MTSDMPLWVSAIVILLCVVLPLLILAFGVWQSLKTWRFMKGAERVMGKVVDIKEHVSHDQDTTSHAYQPVFEYLGPDGTTRRAETALAAAGRNFPLGTTMDILVNADMPEQVRMPGFWVWGMNAIIVLFGLVFASFGMIFLFAP